MATRQQIVEEALAWRGTPWRHQGRTARGIDCAGLVVVVGRALGLLHDDHTNYPRRPDGSFVSIFDAYLDRRPVSQAEPGDVLIFAESQHPCHCGIQVLHYGQPGIVHAHAARKQVMIETLEQARSVVGKPIFCHSYRGVEG